MRLRQFPLVAALALALVASGVLPPDHVHPSAPTRSQVIHAHWEIIEVPPAHAAFAAHDDHDDAVTLNRVMTVGPSSRVPSQPAALPRCFGAAAAAPTDVLASAGDSEPGPSPPPRPTAPRAPPA